MELKFITREQFEKASTYVQNYLKEYFNYINTLYDNGEKILYGKYIDNIYNVPLLTEGQIIDIIENELSYIVGLDLIFGKGYKVNLAKDYDIETNKFNRLDALWEALIDLIETEELRDY